MQNNNYYIVDDNTTNISNGITNKGYSGEIRGIGQYAFYKCASITRVTIFAKLIRINCEAFNGCWKGARKAFSCVILFADVFGYYQW